MALQTPEQYFSTRLQAHWDASSSANIIQAAGSVSQVSDLSGKGRPLSQGTASSQPAYAATGGPNGQGTLVSASQWMEASVPAQTFASGFIFAALVRTTGGGNGYASLPLTRCVTNGAVPASLDGYNATRAIGDGNGYTFQTGPDMSSDSRYIDWNILICSLDTSQNYIERVNGTQVVSIGGGYYGDTSGVITFGTRGDRFTTFTGNLVEAGANSGAYALADVQWWEGYLAWHADGGTAGVMVGKLPAGHPYKTTMPSVASGTTYTGSIALGLTPAHAASAQFTGKGTSTLALIAALSGSGKLTGSSTASLGAVSALTATGGAIYRASVPLAAVAALAGAPRVSAGASAALAEIAGLTGSALTSAAAALTLGALAATTTSSGLSAASALALAQVAGLSDTSTVSASQAAALALALASAASAGGAAYGSALALAASAVTAAAGQGAASGSASLAAVPALAEIGRAHV